MKGMGQRKWHLGMDRSEVGIVGVQTTAVLVSLGRTENNVIIDF